jgi:hypothetical protein
LPRELVHGNLGSGRKAKSGKPPFIADPWIDVERKAANSMHPSALPIPVTLEPNDFPNPGQVNLTPVSVPGKHHVDPQRCGAAGEGWEMV